MSIKLQKLNQIGQKPQQQVLESSYRPLASMLSDPISVLHCDEAKLTSAFKELKGAWSNIVAQPSTPSALRKYSTRVGPVTVTGVTLYLFKDNQQVAEVQTDQNGEVIFAFPTNIPLSANYTVSLIPQLLGVSNPLQDVFQFSCWFVTCKVTNLTDIWWRIAGRSFTGTLERYFDPYPARVIGLLPPFGTAFFIDIVPIFGDTNVSLVYGTTAWCNTTNPAPSAQECDAARKTTWWKFAIEAFNGKVTKQVEGKCNIDRQLKVTFTADDISGTTVVPQGATT